MKPGIPDGGRTGAAEPGSAPEPAASHALSAWNDGATAGLLPPTRDRRALATERSARTPLGLTSDACSPGAGPLVEDAALPLGSVLILLGPDGDPDGTDAVLAEGGFEVRLGAADPATLRAALADPPGLIVAHGEPDEAAAIVFHRRLEDALGAFAPPLVLLTTRDDEGALRRAFEEGVRDVLPKPVPPALLRVKVKQLLRPATAARRRVGPYVVRRVLGRGGMGTVYEAAREGVEVALKVLDAAAIESHPESLARFRRETETLEALAHPGIPRFFEAGRAGDAFYCAMELVRGPSVTALLARGPLSEAAVRRILLEVGSALEAVHGARLVHRDVKPANILVTNDASRRVRLVDFGLAKDVDDRALTRHDEIMGTAAYLAPEVARGRPADARSDAFALGMTALEAASGRCPLRGPAAEVLHELALGNVPSPSELVRGASDALLTVLEGLLAPDASERMPLAEIPRVFGV